MVVSVCIALVANGEHVFMSLLTTLYISGEIFNHMFCPFLSQIISFYYCVMCSLYILDISPISPLIIYD